MKIDGSIHKSGFPIDFVPVLLKPIKNEHIMSPFELKMIALFKKNKGKKKKGKKKKTKKKGGRKSKHNIKMARKFRRTRRKRGSGGDGKESSRLLDRYYAEMNEANKLRTDGKNKEADKKQEEARHTYAAMERAREREKEENSSASGADGPGGSGGRKRRRSSRKRRRRTKKRKSRRRKKRSRRRRRKKR